MLIRRTNRNLLQLMLIRTILDNTNISFQNCVHISIDQEHTKGEIERFLISQNRQNATFRGNPLLQSHEQYKTKQKT